VSSASTTPRAGGGGACCRAAPRGCADPTPSARALRARTSRWRSTCS
jgi:hypothetical protein